MSRSLLRNALLFFALTLPATTRMIAADLSMPVAADVTGTPGAAKLTAKFPMKESESPMRFEHLASARPQDWRDLDLKTGSAPLKTSREGNVTAVTLPNGGTCAITQRKEFYQLTFSSPDTGVDAQVPVAKGNLLLLGSPVSNAHDAQYVLITLKNGVEAK